jgi:glucose/arabinose dehydrogenase
MQVLSFRAATFILLAGVLATSFGAAPNPAPDHGVGEQDAYRVVTIVEGLQNPWSMAWLPNGDMLVTERAGRLRIVKGGMLQPEPIAGVPAVRAAGQGGLLDVVLHPNFASNRLLYLSFAKAAPEGNIATTAVVRAEFDGTRLNNVREIFAAKDFSPRNHFGSRMVFDAQGFLYITAGDKQMSPVGSPEQQARHNSQNLMVHHGKVMRIHDDGRVPADNPFVGRTDALPEIWSYGHRNPQGLAVHPQTGDIWSTEHAAQGGDELNIIQRGRNYGWPVIGMGVNYGGGQIHATKEREGMEQPVHHWLPSIGTSGLMVYTGDKFPQWRGNIFAGGLVGQQIARLTMDGRRVVSQELIVRNMGRVRDIRQGPDGYIYVAFDNSRPESISIARLEPEIR